MSVNSIQATTTHATTTTNANKYLKLSETEKRAHVRSYVKSNLTRQAYCEQHGLKLSSFKNWATRYGRKQKDGFVPVIATPQGAIAHRPPHIAIYKGDCKVTLNDISNVKLVVEIIKGVFACN